MMVDKKYILGEKIFSVVLTIKFFSFPSCITIQVLLSFDSEKRFRSRFGIFYFHMEEI